MEAFGMRRLFALLVLSWPIEALSASSLADVQDGAQLMVSSAYICSDYMQDPTILAGARARARAILVAAGMTAADSDSFLDQSIDAVKGQPTSVARKQAACETIDVRVLN
jgi:hypothetical protein